jgi:type VI secretion system protein ImpG
MSEVLYPYYERELAFVRQQMQEFARQYPAVAGRLLLEPNRSSDPHVERLIEAFALLTARIRRKLDDEFPELTDALLGILYPHLLAYIPSLAVVQFDLDPARLTQPGGFVIERHSKLHTRAGGGHLCRFRTAYPVALWPVQVTAAQLMPPPFPAGLAPPPRTQAVLRLQLETQAGMRFPDLQLDRLRFYLAGEGQLVASLYELLFNHVTQVAFRPLAHGSQPVATLRPEECLGPVGFEADEGLLPYGNQSFVGYRLLSEFFAFPNKFLFFDLLQLQRLRQPALAGGAEVILFLNRTQTNLEQSIDAQTFRLGCTPIVNLFEQTAEPIALTQARSEYRIIPDVANPVGLEVYAVESVTGVDPDTGASTEYQPFYSFRHGQTQESHQAFWYAARRESLRQGDRGTEVYLNLVDLRFNPRLPAESTLVVRTTCSNRNVAEQLQRLGDRVAFQLEAAAPLARIRCLRPPTTPLHPPLARGGYWRLVSQLSLNYLSLTDAAQGLQALQEILRLYDFANPEEEQQLSAVTRNLVEGITSVSSRRVVGRTGGPVASGFCRGLEITVGFDEEKFIGTGAFLFACVLERFFALYCTLNSFTQLVAKIEQREGILKKWPPRAGEQTLL